MRMLMIDQRLAMISFAGLKKLGKSGMRRGQRLGGKHLAETGCCLGPACAAPSASASSPTRPCPRRAGRPAGCNRQRRRHAAIKSQAASDLIHIRLRRRRRLPSCAGTNVRRRQPIGLGVRHIHARHVHVSVFHNLVFLLMLTSSHVGSIILRSRGRSP